MVALLATTLLSPVAFAKNDRSASDRNNRNGSSEQAGTQVRVTRASNILGADVTASDGHKVGDIADLIYDTSSTPHLKYVVVVSGGFLGYGGEARAVPAEAISSDGDSAKLEISTDDYWGVELLPNNRERFLSDRTNVDQLNSAFNLSDKNNNERSNQNTQSQSSGSSYVSFSELNNADVYDRDGNRLGRFVDTWVSLDRSRAPYVEISSPPASPFSVTPRHRFAVPMNRLQADNNEYGSYRLDITESDLRDSKMISEAKGVEMLRSGEIGDAILRVRVAQR